eukprot:scaffold67444_cov24-Cyclotella_meneghiniana.AAC.6
MEPNNLSWNDQQQQQPPPNQPTETTTQNSTWPPRVSNTSPLTASASASSHAAPSPEANRTAGIYWQEKSSWWIASTTISTT